MAWRLGGDLVAIRVSWRLSRVSGESREIQTCSIFRRLFPVSSRSRRRLRGVSIICSDVAETNIVRDLGKRLRSACWHHRDAFTPGLRTSPWRRLGESASHVLVSRVARVARVAATDKSRRRNVSANEICPLRLQPLNH